MKRTTIPLSVLSLLSSQHLYSQKLPERPNFLLIITDQQSAESMCYIIGDRYISTPNMDYLARQGITFTNAYCASPLSIPSRSSMFPVAEFNDTKWRQYAWAYYRMIEKTDNEIGKILSVLNDSGLDKNTVIVFLADHGDCQGAHRWNQKTVFFEEASKVPFIISNPGLKSSKCDYLVQTGIDLMPTLCELAGISLKNPLPGKSLKKLVMTGSDPEKQEYIVVSDKLIQGDTDNGHKPEPEGRMLRNSCFKYWILNEGKQRETLYDLQNDPGEMVNLAGDPEFNGDLEDSRKQLPEWAEKYNDPYIQYLLRK